MPFALRVSLPVDLLPPLDRVRDHLEEVFDARVDLDEDADRALDRGLRAASWCPWPARTLGLFIDGASARGAEVALRRDGDAIEVRTSMHVMGSWTDWRLVLELSIHLAEQGDGYCTLQGGGRVATSNLRARYLEDPAHYERELLAGLEAIERSVEQGRVVRLGGPRGTAAVGPRTWPALAEHEDPDERAEAVIELILSSLGAEGFEDYYPANLLCLDGRTGREVLASLLPPDKDTLLRDPEFVLLSANLEAGPEEPLFVLPFERLGDAFPGRLRWLDDCTVAVPAIPRSEWASHVARLRPMLTPLHELLDGPPEEGDPDAWRRFVDDDGAQPR